MLEVNAADLVIGATAGKGQKHHYIPALYSKGWAGPDGCICEYSRPFRTVKPRRVDPDGTGYERGLYTVKDPRVGEYIEDVFFKRTDDDAAKVLQKLRLGGEIVWTNETRSAWTRFVFSLMVRTPEHVKRLAAEVADYYDTKNIGINERYRTLRGPEEPETYAEYVARNGHPAARASAITLQTLVDSKTMGGHFIQMRWSIIRFTGMRRNLLTSDRPLIMTNGLGQPDGHLALPIGPFALFVATNNLATDHMIRSRNPLELMEHVNDRVASQARKYVWGMDDTQLRFIENRLGKKEPAVPMENLVLSIPVGDIWSGRRLPRTGGNQYEMDKRSREEARRAAELLGVHISLSRTRKTP